MKKSLFIIKVLYFRYFFLFMINNIINYLIYINNKFYINKINKKSDNK